MCMHARAIDAIERLRQKSRIKAMLHGNRLEYILGRHQPISNVQRIAYLKIEFMLTGRHLMMTGLNSDTHLLQSLYHLTTNGSREIGRKVKVTPSIMRQGCWSLIFLTEQEKF